MPVTLTNCTNIHFDEYMNILIYFQFFCLFQKLNMILLLLLISNLITRRKGTTNYFPTWKYLLLESHCKTIPGLGGHQQVGHSPIQIQANSLILHHQFQ